MAIKNAMNPVSYLGTYLIPDEKYHKVAMASYSKDDETQIIYISEIYTHKQVGASDSDQYQMRFIPDEWIDLGV